MRRLAAVLTAASVLLTLALITTAQARVPDAPVGEVTYDEYLAGHDVEDTFDFAKNETDKSQRLGEDGENAGYSGDYGHEGCKIAEEYEVGATEMFWVSPNVANTPQENKQIEATLVDKSDNGYFWVESQYYAPVPEDGTDLATISDGEAAAALADWEKIYPTTRKYFGQEPKKTVVPKNLPPGLPADWRDADCDNRVHILNFPIDTPGASTGYIAGYYSSEHEYPNGTEVNQSRFSNEKEMFFMNSAMLDPGNEDGDYAGVLAHEFFHMIQFGNDYNETTWVNEGLADIAAVVNGFEGVVDGHVSAYSEDPDQSLLDWGSDVSDYGHSFLFFDYFFNHYGQPEDPKTEYLEAYGLAKLLTRTSADGEAGVSRVIATRSDALKQDLDKYFRTGTFGKVFKDNLVANYLDMPEAASGQFGYKNRDVAVANAGTEDTSPDDATVYPYGGEYYEITGKGGFTATAQDPVPVIPAKEGMPKGQYFAWSNRSDEMTTWLQRSVNLSDATAPQLIFKYWYQIEEDWDYAYVRVSKNGGKTWEYQTTTDCGGRATDPNGNNRAVEESGGITGDSEGWQTCTLELAEYAGEKVLIRFEYDTDQAVTEAGYVVDNVRVKDGDKKIFGPSRFEQKMKAWKFGGDGLLDWLRIEPEAKNKPLYQVVTVNGEEVTRQVLRRRHFETKDGQLVLKKERSFDGDKTVLIFSSTTPIATDPFAYSYNVTR